MQTRAARAGLRSGTSLAGALLLVLAVACSGGSGGSDAPDPAGSASTLAADVEEYLTAVDPAGQVRAVLVEHDRDLLLERYTGAAAGDYWDLQSVTKSVISTLVGIAVGEGDISGVEATLGELLPPDTPGLTDEVADVRLEQVLTHTANMRAEGAPGDDYFLAPDWVRRILTDRAEDGPGDGSFAYSNAGAHLVSAVLEEATGQSALGYARAHLLDPLGIPSRPALEQSVDVRTQAGLDRLYADYYAADFAWPVDPQGVQDGACCLKLRPRDLLALGRLYLDGGRWHGTQVVPASWVRESTAAHVEAGTTGYDYGYLWWVTDVAGKPAYYAFGAGGQLVEVVPSLDLVVVLVTELDARDPMRETKLLGPDSATDLVELVVAPAVEH